MWWFIGVKKAVEKLEEEVKQLKCKHPAGDNIFVEERYYVLGLCGRNLERKCSKCGAILESFGSEFAMQIAKGEWHKKEAERLDVDKLLGICIKKLEKRHFLMRWQGKQKTPRQISRVLKRPWESYIQT